MALEQLERELAAQHPRSLLQKVPGFQLLIKEESDGGGRGCSGSVQRPEKLCRRDPNGALCGLCSQPPEEPLPRRPTPQTRLTDDAARHESGPLLTERRSRRKAP